ncbi:hypothetical protein MY04_06110 [Flammeovirga sp. MY04]|uniref:hypothetical protein n=1 Tax=Flammeovirga sp. MY04 TaxID=1191459 RepID=UPI00130547DB|nr:hypothetical protein [Flammeovirga sp. MY04]QJD09402.1 hypothetical protein MY04_06110 [Flammeovirga sp. MY04]
MKSFSVIDREGRSSSDNEMGVSTSSLVHENSVTPSKAVSSSFRLNCMKKIKRLKN